MRDDLSRLRLDEWGSDRDSRDRCGVCREHSARMEADVQLLVQVHGLETWSFASHRYAFIGMHETIWTTDDSGVPCVA